MIIQTMSANFHKNLVLRHIVTVVGTRWDKVDDRTGVFVAVLKSQNSKYIHVYTCYTI